MAALSAASLTAAAAAALQARRVLSIQSHVVHGCVGNRAAALPLQLLGVLGRNVQPTRKKGPDIDRIEFCADRNLQRVER